MNFNPSTPHDSPSGRHREFTRRGADEVLSWMAAVKVGGERTRARGGGEMRRPQLVVAKAPATMYVTAESLT